ncbi:O-Antigen ligase [compost metagenome]
MSVHLILLLLLVLMIGLFTLQCIYQFGMKIDAGYVIGFSLYFDMIGFLYKQAMPGNALFLLVAVPMLPALIAWFSKGERTGDILKDSGIWLWLLVLLYGLATLTWTPPGSNGLYKMIILVVHAVIPGVYAYIIYKKYGKFSWTIVALFGLAYAATHLVFGEYTDEYPGRLALPGSNPIINARMSLITISISLWGRGIPLMIRIITIVVAGISAFATESRGPLVAFIIANGMIAVFSFFKKYRREGLKKLQSYLAAFLILLAAGGLVASQYSAELETWVSNSRFAVLFDHSELQGDANYIGRLDLQRKAFQTWNEHPFIGAGLGSVTPPIARDFPHNVILEIACELGIIGLLLWSLAYLNSLWIARSQMVLLVLLLQTIGTALVSGDFGYNFEYLLFAFVSLALYKNEQREVAENHDKSSVSYHRF